MIFLIDLNLYMLFSHFLKLLPSKVVLPQNYETRVPNAEAVCESPLWRSGPEFLSQCKSKVPMISEIKFEIQTF